MIYSLSGIPVAITARCTNGRYLPRHSSGDYVPLRVHIADKETPEWVAIREPRELLADGGSVEIERTITNAPWCAVVCKQPAHWSVMRERE